jgi:hypothetical protein
MDKDIQFLKELQTELNSQSNDSQASPRFWTVGDYRWEITLEGNAERYSVYLPRCGESSEIKEFYESLEHDDLEKEALEALEDVDSEDETAIFDWIQEHYDDGATFIPEKKEHFIRQNTMFLTKQEAKDHIEMNHYHYTKEAHTYAMTAWRAPKVERLLKILSEFDFERFCIADAIVTTESARAEGGLYHARMLELRS